MSEECHYENYRCVLCCGIDESVSRDSYEKLFHSRTLLFRSQVRLFPHDLKKYAESLDEPAFLLCPYLGFVDDNPGCLIHPEEHEGIDIRSVADMPHHYKYGCIPNSSCFYTNYLKTSKEKKIFTEFMQPVSDWYTFSLQKRRAALFNQKHSYLIERLPIDMIAVDEVTGIQETIHTTVINEFCGGKKQKKVWQRFGPDMSVMRHWGPSGRFPAQTFQSESRFEVKDFVHCVVTEDDPVYIFQKTGEILPLDFSIVSIADEKTLLEAVSVIDDIINHHLSHHNNPHHT